MCFSQEGSWRTAFTAHHTDMYPDNCTYSVVNALSAPGISILIARILSLWLHAIGPWEGPSVKSLTRLGQLAGKNNTMFFCQNEKKLKKSFDLVYLWASRIDK